MKSVRLIVLIVGPGVPFQIALRLFVRCSKMQIINVCDFVWHYTTFRSSKLIENASDSYKESGF
jgi:hypothetical protein